MFLSLNHGDTKSLDLFDSEETPPPTKKKATAWQNQAGPQKPPLQQKRNSVSIFFWRYAPIIIFTFLVVVIDGGIHGNSPSGIVCSGVGVDDVTDVASLLTVVLMAIPPMAVEEAGLWTALNYQARVICANVINCMDCIFDQNWQCVYIGPAFF